MPDKTIVQTRTLKLALPPGGFPLVNGGVLPAVEVAYETYGQLAPDGRNAIAICPTLTSDAHVAGYHAETDPYPGWWDGLIGPGRGLDPNRYFVVGTNILGGCQGTTGPRSVNPATGAPYGADFPLITIKDAVRVQKLFLEQLGVTELHCVIGGSLGGMQALEWAICYPDFVRRCICIAAAGHLSPQALAFDVIGRQCIEHDPDWRGGRYQEAGGQPAGGLSRARQIGHVTYLSSASMANRFGRDTRPDVPAVPASKFSTEFQVEGYLDHQGAKFVRRFDANSYLHITRMLDLFDLPKEYGSLRQAVAGVRSRMLLISISSDWLFPPAQQLELVMALIAERKDVSYFTIESDLGHDAFLLEYDTLNTGVAAFVDGAVPAAPPTAVARADLEEIAPMLAPGQRVLDVGSGDGNCLLLLAKTRHVTGLCLDYQFAMVADCMRKGLNAVQLDADTALSRIPDSAFDVVLLNQTIQQLHRALQTLKQSLRLAPVAIVGFPNFAYVAHRFELFFRGTLPVSEALPYQWYDTPNLHLVTVTDFRDLCAAHDLDIAEIHYLAGCPLGRLLIRLGLPNLGAERVLARLGRGPRYRPPEPVPVVKDRVLADSDVT